MATKYTPITDKHFWKKLTKKEILHLLIDGGVKDLESLNRVFRWHENERKRLPDPQNEPCWECRAILDKLKPKDKTKEIVNYA